MRNIPVIGFLKKLDAAAIPYRLQPAEGGVIVSFDQRGGEEKWDILIPTDTKAKMKAHRFSQRMEYVADSAIDELSNLIGDISDIAYEEPEKEVYNYDSPALRAQLDRLGKALQAHPVS